MHCRDHVKSVCLFHAQIQHTLEMSTDWLRLQMVI